LEAEIHASPNERPQEPWGYLSSGIVPVDGVVADVGIEVHIPRLEFQRVLANEAA